MVRDFQGSKYPYARVTLTRSSPSPVPLFPPSLTSQHLEGEVEGYIGYVTYGITSSLFLILSCANSSLVMCCGEVPITYLSNSEEKCFGAEIETTEECEIYCRICKRYTRWRYFASHEMSCY